jgi:hypothetical protein
MVREGFASDYLLLSHNDSELPKRTFSINSISNKKLRNLNQCVTRQVFIRKNYDFTKSTESNDLSSPCALMSDSVVQEFLRLWSASRSSLDGEWLAIEGDARYWYPASKSSAEILVKAHEVLQLFYARFGGIWTGCFKLEKLPDCRGALAGNITTNILFLFYFYFI